MACGEGHLMKSFVSRFDVVDDGKKYTGSSRVHREVCLMANVTILPLAT
jgi:hypothetical protein